MRKFLYCMVLCVYCCFSGAAIFAGCKIALLGDSDKATQLADLVVAEFSGRLDFVERSEMDRILKEQNLHKSGLIDIWKSNVVRLLHADVFAVILSAETGLVTVPSSLRVFSARNGFCLVDSALPDGIDKSAEFIGAQLELGIKALSDLEKLKFVAVSAVRDFGVPSSYRRKMDNVAVLLERRLLAMPDVAVLERAELELVNQERGLTDKIFSLTPSAYLMELEFSPATTAEIIDMKINIMDVSGRVLVHFKFPDIFNSEFDGVIKVLADYFKVALPLEGTDARQEARRFFNEYSFFRSIRNHSVAKRKVEAAIALDPDEPDYLYGLAEFTGSVNLARHDDLHSRFQMLKKSMAIYDEINERFPDYDKCLYDIPVLWMWDRFASVDGNWDIPPENIRKVMPILREKAFPQMFKHRWQFCLSDGIGSAQELYNVINYSREYCNMRWFLNYRDYYDFSRTWSVEFIKSTGRFLRENPQYLDKCSNIVPVFGMESFGNRAEFFLEFEKSLLNCQEVIDAAADHPDKSVRDYSKTLEFYRAIFMNNYDEKFFRAQLETYMKQNDGMPLQLHEFIKNNKCMSVRGALNKVIAEVQLDFLNHKKDGDDLQLLALRMRKAKNVEELSQLIIDNKSVAIRLYQQAFIASPTNEVNKLRNDFRDWEYKLTSSHSAICREAIVAMNDPLQIRVLKKSTDFQGGGLEIVNKIMHGGDLYLLIKFPDEDNSYYSRFAVFCYSLQTDNLRKLHVLKRRSRDMSQGKRIPFYVGDRFFIVGVDDAIVVLPRDNNPPYEINDLPGEKVMSLTFMNDRIYAFLTNKGFYSGMRKATKTVLLSCAADGGQRRIDIFAGRPEKQNFFDEQSPFTVEYMYADEAKKRLLCGIGHSKVGGLWAFYPETGQAVNCIPELQIGYNGNFIWCMQAGSRLMVTSAKYNFFIYDIISDKADFFIYTSMNSDHLKTKPQLHKYLNLRGPFLVHNNILWYSGEYAGYIDCNSEDNDPRSLFGISKYQLQYFPHPDGHSVILVNRDSIFLISNAAKAKEPQGR